MPGFVAMMPVDKQGADALFQIISQRYEHGATVI
jgi:DNA replication protein DnaC